MLFLAGNGTKNSNKNKMNEQKLPSHQPVSIAILNMSNVVQFCSGYTLIYQQYTSTATKLSPLKHCNFFTFNVTYNLNNCNMGALVIT